MTTFQQFVKRLAIALRLIGSAITFIIAIVLLINIKSVSIWAGIMLVLVAISYHSIIQALAWVIGGKKAVPGWSYRTMFTNID